MSLRDHIPWWGKIGAKIVLSRLRIPAPVFRCAGVFRHGAMDASDYVLDVFSHHVRGAGLGDDLRGRTILEIGPGDGVGTALLAYAHGARAVLLDSGRYAREDIRPYRQLAQLLRERGQRAPALEGARGIDDVVAACEAVYLTKGLDSWRKLPAASVDLMFSQAVLEHIRRDQFAETLRQCRRVMKPDAVASHRIDLKDHLGGGLNNLRFRESLWESDWFARSGFYTNRIQYHQMLQFFTEAGFSVSVTDARRWPQLPIERKRLAPEFRNVPNEELTISGFDVLLRPK